jgi:hypothetical protein
MRFPHSHSLDDDPFVALHTINERSPSHHLIPLGSSFDEKMLGGIRPKSNSAPANSPISTPCQPRVTRREKLYFPQNQQHEKFHPLTPLPRHASLESGQEYLGHKQPSRPRGLFALTPPERKRNHDHPGIKGKNRPRKRRQVQRPNHPGRQRPFPRQRPQARPALLHPPPPRRAPPGHPLQRGLPPLLPALSQPNQVLPAHRPGPLGHRARNRHCPPRPHPRQGHQH